MKTILTTVLAACTMVGGFSSYTPAHPCADTTTVRRGDHVLELYGARARLADTRRGVSHTVPVDQVVVDTEKGPMAVIGDEAVPLTGRCEARAAERALAK